MKRALLLSLFIATLLATGTLAQEPGAVPVAPRREIVDVAGLPRVLTVGDSISGGYDEPLRKLLSGKANVHHADGYGGPTTTGISHIDKLPSGHWDIITFNYGLHDMKLDTGSHQVDIPQYEANLKIIADGLRKTGAKLIWVTTTPVPTGKLSPPRERADAPLYNEAAARALQGKVDAVCDLYTAMLPHEAELQMKQNVHYTPAGYDFLAQQLAASIESLLRR